MLNCILFGNLIKRPMQDRSNQRGASMYCRKKTNYQVGSIQNLSRNTRAYNFIIFIRSTNTRTRQMAFIQKKFFKRVQFWLGFRLVNTSISRFFGVKDNTEIVSERPFSPWKRWKLGIADKVYIKRLFRHNMVVNKIHCLKQKFSEIPQ